METRFLNLCPVLRVGLTNLPSHAAINNVCELDDGNYASGSRHRSDSGRKYTHQPSHGKEPISHSLKTIGIGVAFAKGDNYATVEYA